jgi:hypothetical protein
MRGNHDLILYVEGEAEVKRIEIEANVLLWEQDGLTYRIETKTELEEAIKSAQSLQPISE